MIFVSFNSQLPSGVKSYQRGDAFTGYQKDTPAAVVFQVTNQLKKEGLAVSIQDCTSTESVGVLGPTAVEEEENDSHIYLERKCKLFVKSADVSVLCLRFREEQIATNYYFGICLEEEEVKEILHGRSLFMFGIAAMPFLQN